MRLEERCEHPLTFWERVSKTQWGRYISELERSAILKAHQCVGYPRTGLEIGCDGGRWSQLLSSLGWAMTCTDVSKEAVSICQQRVQDADCRLVQPGDTTLPCRAGSMGLVVCIEVQPVIESGWFLSEAHRVLCDSGLLVGVLWNRYSLRGFRARAINSLRGGNDPFYQVPYVHWKRSLEKQSFRMLYERGLCWFPFRRNSNSSLVRLCARIEQSSGLCRLVSLSPWIIFIAQKQSKRDSDK
jgi:SAM-dependent methyltransferase